MKLPFKLAVLLVCLAVVAVAACDYRSTATVETPALAAQLVPIPQSIEVSAGKLRFSGLGLAKEGLNAPNAEHALDEMFVGGISNGITGVPNSDRGAGISFAPGPDLEPWRSVEQWIPHTAWMLFAVMAPSED